MSVNVNIPDCIEDSTKKYLVDIFDELIVQPAWVRKYAGMNVYFLHGPREEISSILERMTKAPVTAAKKYPLIALFQDFDETASSEIGIQSTVKLDLAIMTLTKSTYTAKERYAHSFKPKLVPILEALMFSIMNCGYFMETSEYLLKYTRSDRMRWGKGKINNFDFIDAIEISNFNLTIKINES